MVWCSWQTCFLVSCNFEILLDEWEGQKLEGGGIRNRKQSDRKIRRLIREVKDINIDALKNNILIPGWCTRRHLLCCDQERNTVTNLRNHPSCFCWKKRGFKRFVGRHYQGPAETEDTIPLSRLATVSLRRPVQTQLLLMNLPPHLRQKLKCFRPHWN